MNQFKKILKFELSYYLKNKVFVGTTLLLVLAITAVMCWPLYSGVFDKGNASDPDSLPVMLVKAYNEEQEQLVESIFGEAFPGYTVTAHTGDEASFKEAIITGGAECGFVLTGPDSFSYYVGNLSMYDSNAQIAEAAMRKLLQTSALISSGMNESDASAIMNMAIHSEVEALGKDQASNFF